MFGRCGEQYLGFERMVTFKMNIGEFIINGPTKQDIDIFGQSPNKNQTTGIANSYIIIGPGSIELLIHDTN